MKLIKELYEAYLIAYARVRSGTSQSQSFIDAQPLASAIAADDVQQGKSPRSSADFNAVVESMSGPNDATA